MEAYHNSVDVLTSNKTRYEGRTDYYQSCVIIQRCFRNYLFKKRIKRLVLKKYEENAIIIQRAYRNYRSNKEERIKQICLQLFNENAIIIQRFYRNYKLMKEFNNLN